MTDVPRALIVYATTSWSTAEVAALFRRALGGFGVTTLDLGAVTRGQADLPVGRFELVIVGTPTYGRGDWHDAWRRCGGLVVRAMRGASTVMLFGLGDSRGYPATFAGGLRVLHAFVAAAEI